MKYPLFALSLALGLAAPAFAQDMVSIMQQGNDRTVSIAQLASGGGNEIKVEQGSGPGNGGSVAIVQSQVSSSFAGVGDYGVANSYAVDQRDGSNLIAMINDRGGYGENNVGMIKQTGFDSEARLNQLGFDNKADVAQFGGRNFALLMQDGAANVAGITQTGNASTVIMQTGTGNTATVTQGPGFMP